MENKILKAAGKRGKTVHQIAEQLGISPSYAARHIKSLASAGQLVQKKTQAPSSGTGRPAVVWGQP